MTVREWYRLQRGALYVNQPELFHACDLVATALCDQQRPLETLYIGTFAVVCFNEEQVRQAELRIRLQEEMDEALRRLRRQALMARGGFE